jgi:hypothetical protein
MLMRPLRNRYAVGGIEDCHVNEIAKCRIAQSRGARRGDKAMRVKIGRIEIKISFAWIGLMPQLFGIELGQTIDVTYFERIARFQGEMHAAI